MTQQSPRGLFDHVVTLMGVLQQAPGQVHVRVWTELRPWISDLVSRASVKWVERLAAHVRCGVVQRDPTSGEPIACTGSAIAGCLICRRPTCVKHAFIDGSGEAVCFGCISNAVRGQTTAPATPKDELAAARKVLKVKASATWDEVRSAHRKISAKYHPDKFQSDADKAKAEEKFKAAQRAFDLLKKEHESAAA